MRLKIDTTDCKLVQPLWKTILLMLLKNLKVELQYDTAISFLGIYPDRTLI